MTAEDAVRGWWDMPALPEWTCPEEGCGVTSPVEEWEECLSGCSDCGDHEGRRCPACGAVFDHVWGVHYLVGENVP